MHTDGTVEKLIFNYELSGRVYIYTLKVGDNFSSTVPSSDEGVNTARGYGGLSSKIQKISMFLLINIFKLQFYTKIFMKTYFLKLLLTKSFDLPF